MGAPPVHPPSFAVLYRVPCVSRPAREAGDLTQKETERERERELMGSKMKFLRGGTEPNRKWQASSAIKARETIVGHLSDLR
jgi:hypothetical protein